MTERLPPHIEAELNRLGVRARPEAMRPVEPTQPPDNGWYNRGEECPF